MYWYCYCYWYVCSLESIIKYHLLDTMGYARHANKIIYHEMKPYINENCASTVEEYNTKTMYPIRGFHRYHNHIHTAAELKTHLTPTEAKKLRVTITKKLLDEIDITFLGKGWLVFGSPGNLGFINFDNYLNKQNDAVSTKAWTDHLNKLRQKTWKGEIVAEITYEKTCEFGNSFQHQMRLCTNWLFWVLYKNQFYWIDEPLDPQCQYYYILKERENEGKQYTPKAIYSDLINVPKYAIINTEWYNCIKKILENPNHYLQFLKKGYINPYYENTANWRDRLYDLTLLMI